MPHFNGGIFVLDSDNGLHMLKIKDWEGCSKSVCKTLCVCDAVMRPIRISCHLRDFVYLTVTSAHIEQLHQRLSSQ